MISFTKIQKNIWILLFILLSSTAQASFFGNMKAQFYDQKGDEFYYDMKYPQALEKYKKAAKAGCGHAYFQLFAMYRNGEGTQKDEQSSLEMLKKSAKLKYPMAEVSLARHLLYAKKRDVQGAIRLLEDAAKQENSYAYADLFYIYHYGVGVKKDAVKANRYYRLAKANGYNIKNKISKKSNNISLGKKELITRIQSGLKKLGYYKNKVDGISGPATRKSISNFQKFYGYPVDLKVSIETLKQVNSKLK